jgi:hypothetical protein
VPKQFSWIDHRLVRDRHIEKFTHPAAALYLFLVTVGDPHGVSYYGDKSIMKRLSMDHSTLDSARDSLLAWAASSKKPWRRPHDRLRNLYEN